MASGTWRRLSGWLSESRYFKTSLRVSHGISKALKFSVDQKQRFQSQTWLMFPAISERCAYSDGTKLVLQQPEEDDQSDRSWSWSEPGSASPTPCSTARLRNSGLKENNLKSIEEIVSFQHLKADSAKLLWHNSITYIPEHQEAHQPGASVLQSQ